MFGKWGICKMVKLRIMYHVLFPNLLYKSHNLLLPLHESKVVEVNEVICENKVPYLDRLKDP
jgi:hypothetical protein